MAELRVVLFGQPCLEVGGAARQIRRRKVMALLAYLAMASRPHTRDELAELFFPHLDRDRAFAGLRQSLSYLKAEIGDGALEAASRTVSFKTGHGVFLDVAEFRRHISRAHGARELEHLRAAVELSRGAFMEGFFLRDSPDFEEWQSGQADELRREYASALIRLHDVCLRQGSFEPAAAYARSIVALDRLDESAQRRLIRTLAAAGRRREATKQFESFRGLLHRELDAEPEKETQELLAEIRSGPPGRAASRPVIIGVLPFDNLSEDPGQAYFCDGLTEDLTTALAAIPQLKVAACNTMFAFKGRAPDARQLGRDLDITHLLEGSVQKAGNRVRLNAQLIETGTGSHLWAKRFEKEVSDLFEVQDDIVQCIVTELDVRLASGEQARQWRASTQNSEAYDLFLRARSENVNPEGLMRSSALLDCALVLDPTFVAALCLKGYGAVTQARLGWVSDPEATFAEGRRAVEQALRLDPRCPDAHGGLAGILFLTGKHEEAEKEYELALSLGPAMELTHIACMYFFTWKKDYTRALWVVRKAKELSRFPHSQTYAWEIVALRNLGRLEEALAVAEDALKLFPDGFDIIINHALVCRLLKLREKFGIGLNRILELQPDFTAERWVASSGIRSKEEADRYVAELHQAGFP